MSDGPQPSHGSYSVTGQLDGAGTERVTYTNNGDGATSDSFYLFDEYDNPIVFNITINPTLNATIAVSPATRNEDSGAPFTYTVTLSQTSSSATTVNLTRSGSATSGTDYTGAVNSVVVPANTSTASFTITPVADGTVEADETVIYSVASGTGYGIGSPSSATATILNDDAPTATVSVSPSSVAEDGAPNLVYTVTLSQAPVSALSIGFSVSGTATSGTDYATVSSPLVIAGGTTSGTITVNPTADSTVEPDETVVISLNAGTGYTVGSPNSATGTILNDDQPSLSINDVSVNEGDSGTSNATFTVSLSQPAGAGGVSFDIATTDGTATVGSDYVASSLTGQTIPAGSSSATFTVLVTGETLNEPNETFFVNVSNVTGASVTDAQGLGTIVNDDALPSLSIDDVSVNEGNSGTATATFTVSLSAASGQTVSVNYATADGTATAGSDYVARSGTLTFAPGVTAQSVAVTVNGDTAVEPNETFSVSLSGVSNATVARATGTGTIVNDDAVVVVSPASLTSATAGTSYSQTLNASGGTAPYTFVVTSGSLPSGLTLNSVGVLSGTPTASGNFNFTVGATDSSGTPTSGNRAYTLTVAGPTVTLPTTTLTSGTVGESYTAAITQASGGIAPYTYSLSAGTLPAGVTINSADGSLSGTPTVAGTFAFTLTATDSTAGTAAQASQTYALSIGLPTLSISPSTLDAGIIGNTYSKLLVASGGTSPYTFALSSGALPGGLTLANDGTLTGTPSTTGTFAFAVTATDANGATGSKSYSLEIDALPSLSIDDVSVNEGSSGTSVATFNVTLSATSSQTVTVSYATADGTASAGSDYVAASGTLTFAPGTSTRSITVTINGDTNPEANETFLVQMSAPTNATIAKASAAATIIDDDAPVTVGPVSMAAATVNARYSQTLTAAGGTAPYTYGVTTGSLPSGLTLSSSGVLSGTPTASGSFSFTVTVNDSAVTQNTASRSYTLAVSGPVMTLPATVLADAVTGQSYSAVINPATGGTAPYSYAVSAGALPSGITVNSVDGSLSGTPTVAGTFGFTITATDSTSGTTSQASRNYSLSVGLPSISISPATLDAAVSGKSYSKVLIGSGGTSPYSFALTTGTLPAGLTLASDGTLAGTPSATGTFAFAITATDANGATGSKSYSLQVEAPADFAFSPAGGSLPEAMIGEAYSAGISAAGGTGTLVYSLASGTLPDGLVLNVSTGQLNGPLSETAKSGDYTFSISVRDSNGMTGSASYTIAVKERAVTVTDKVVEVDAGATPPNVYLNRGATGGPFVDANILAVTPANSGSLEIIRGEVAQAGPVAPVGFYLKFTPNPAFSGQVNVGYRLISALGSPIRGWSPITSD
ncbi:beta strand repeat-containing protein [Allorhizobium taibaishanense]|uniref:Autotransporter domain-containing protein n=2 Tax=Allorhizobium taibaishanense TaxID=887144 RepID=A0A1Q9ABT5_9HYPH|nr:putative Ig domain-containing protein [Allorhizobium taibaishanense]OLP52322.1 hypothetical protein BJF91_24370 [Allorhizobium taibaishanense]